MQRPFITMLAILILASSMAGATDMHAETLTQSHGSVFSEQAPDVPVEATGPCDHCCHGSAHTVALRDAREISVSFFPTRVRVVFVSSHHSDWLKAPPTPPPNA